jgi:integrase/recombinase XerD
MFRKFIRTNVARADASPATIELYLRESRFFRDWLRVRNIALQEVTPQVVREWVRSLVELGRSPTTIATKIVVARRLFAAAVEAGIMPKNPADGVQGPKDRRETGAAAQRTLDVDEVKRFLASAPGDSDLAVRDRALLALLCGHGLRTIEIHRLNVADVDLAGKTLVAHGKTRDRTVYLRADVADRLRDLFACRGELAPDAPVFVSHDRSERAKGRRLTRPGIRFIVDRAFALSGLVERAQGRWKALNRVRRGAKSSARAVGGKVPTTHSLRATFVTLAIQHGAAIEYVSRDVGHADLRTTMRYLELKRRRENNSALVLPVEF